MCSPTVQLDWDKLKRQLGHGVAAETSICDNIFDEERNFKVACVHLPSNLSEPVAAWEPARASGTSPSSLPGPSCLRFFFFFFFLSLCCTAGSSGRKGKEGLKRFQWVMCMRGTSVADDGLHLGSQRAEDMPVPAKRNPSVRAFSTGVISQPSGEANMGV